MAGSDINAAGSFDLPMSGAGSLGNDMLTADNPYGVGSYSAPQTATLAGGIGSQTMAPLDYSIGAAGGGGNSPPPAVSDAGTAGTSDSGSGFNWGNILSSLGSIGSGIGSILGNPLISSAALIGAGEYEAGQAQKDTANLTSQLTTPAQPFIQGGVNELNATNQGLTGTPSATGSIGQQESAAQNLGQIATQYSTGQLTPAQQQQVAQQSAAQKQNIRQQLANQGITDASVIAMYDQQIDDNAAQLTQQLTNQNLQMGEQALASVQQTYSNLLNQSISQFGTGMGPLEDAVNITIQQDTQIAQMLNGLFGQIARGFSAASGGAGGGSGAGGAAGAAGGEGGGLNSVVNGIKQLLGGNSTNTAGSSVDMSIPAVESGLGLDSSSGYGSFDQFANASGFDPVTGTYTPPSTDPYDFTMPAQNPFGATSGFDATTGDFDTGGSLADLNLSDFSSAGGQAAAAGAAGLSASDLSALYGAEPGLADLSGAAASAANQTADQALSNASSELAASDAGAASSGIGSTLGEAAGALGAGYGLYNTVKNWQSGATGSDALSAAGTGASIGTMIVPGIGTAIGAVIGGAVGALSSAFGGGKADPETTNWQQFVPAFNQNPAIASELSPAQSFQMLAGVMDGKSTAVGHSEQLEQVFGRMGESNFMSQMAGTINSAIAQGRIPKNATPQQIYAQVVTPWLASKGVTIGSTGDPNNPGYIVNTTQKEGPALGAVIQNLIGAWQSGQFTAATPVGIAGQTVPNLPAYGAGSTGGASGYSLASFTPRVGGLPVRSLIP